MGLKTTDSVVTKVSQTPMSRRLLIGVKLGMWFMNETELPTMVGMLDTMKQELKKTPRDESQIHTVYGKYFSFFVGGGMAAKKNLEGNGFAAEGWNFFEAFEVQSDETIVFLTAR